MGESFEVRRNKRLRVKSRDVMDDARDEEGKKVRNSIRWKVLSKYMRKIQPTCPDPFGVHGAKVVPSEEVHHIEPILEAPHKAYDPSNLISLCRSCHRRADILNQTDPIYQKQLMKAHQPKREMRVERVMLDNDSN